MTDPPENQPQSANASRRKIPWWAWAALVAGVIFYVLVLTLLIVTARSDKHHALDGHCTEYSPGVWGESQDYPGDPDCPNYGDYPKE